MNATTQERTFKVMEGRRWIHVAERLSNGQYTARWSFDTKHDVWHMSEGWKVPNRHACLSREQGAVIEGLLGEQLSRLF